MLTKRNITMFRSMCLHSGMGVQAPRCALQRLGSAPHLRIAVQLTSCGRLQ